jgi:diacylglycerol kinase (ATP)
MSIRILLNPGAGRGRGARMRERLAALARRAGLPVEESRDAGDLTARAARAAAEGVERLLVAGGDGTWNLAARGLVGSATALAPVPLGTGNDLARALGYPLAPAPAFAAALEGSPARLDLGRFGERLYCGVAGAGFDGAVATRARERLRWLRGPAVYAWATLVTLATYRPPRFRLSLDGGAERQGTAWLVVFANISCTGGGMRIAPGADPTDGRLDLVGLEGISKAGLLRLFPRVYAGRHLGHPAVFRSSCAAGRLAFDTVQRAVGDGEGFGEVGPRGVEVGILPAALPVIRAGGGRRSSPSGRVVADPGCG